MGDIDRWLERFAAAWQRHDVDGVLALFSDDATYHETPTKQLQDEELRTEWETIHDQRDIVLDWTVYSSDGDRHTVQWELAYTQDGERRELHGIYLVTLDADGQCVAFWQYCQNA